MVGAYCQSNVGDEKAYLGLDSTTPNPSRIYNYWLGGKDNYAADRQAARWSVQASAGGMLRARQAVRANRAFHARAVRYLTRTARVHQFLDIGAGLPAAPNTHEIAQQGLPHSRVVYVDNDRVVVTHARALLAGTVEGPTACFEADLRDPEIIVRAAAATLNFSQPIALLLLAVLPFVPDSDDPYQAVSRLLEAVPPGSYLAASHPTGDLRPADAQEFQHRYNQSAAVKLTLRTRAEFSRFFYDLDLIPPAIVQADLWRPDVPTTGHTSSIPIYCGLGKKPGPGLVA